MPYITFKRNIAYIIQFYLHRKTGKIQPCHSSISQLHQFFPHQTFPFRIEISTPPIPILSKIACQTLKGTSGIKGTSKIQYYSNYVLAGTITPHHIAFDGSIGHNIQSKSIVLALILSAFFFTFRAFYSIFVSASPEYP